MLKAFEGSISCSKISNFVQQFHSGQCVDGHINFAPVWRHEKSLNGKLLLGPGISPKRNGHRHLSLKIPNAEFFSTLHFQH